MSYSDEQTNILKGITRRLGETISFNDITNITTCLVQNADPNLNDRHNVPLLCLLARYSSNSHLKKEIDDVMRLAVKKGAKINLDVNNNTSVATGIYGLDTNAMLNLIQITNPQSFSKNLHVTTVKNIMDLPNRKSLSMEEAKLIEQALEAGIDPNMRGKNERPLVFFLALYNTQTPKSKWIGIFDDLIKLAVEKGAIVNCDEMMKREDILLKENDKKSKIPAWHGIKGPAAIHLATFSKKPTTGLLHYLIQKNKRGRYKHYIAQLILGCKVPMSSFPSFFNHTALDVELDKIFTVPDDLYERYNGYRDRNLCHADFANLDVRSIYTLLECGADPRTQLIGQDGGSSGINLFHLLLLKLGDLYKIEYKHGRPVAPELYIEIDATQSDNKTTEKSAKEQINTINDTKKLIAILLGKYGLNVRERVSKDIPSVGYYPTPLKLLNGNPMGIAYLASLDNQIILDDPTLLHQVIVHPCVDTDTIMFLLSRGFDVDRLIPKSTNRHLYGIDEVVNGKTPLDLVIQHHPSRRQDIALLFMHSATEKHLHLLNDPNFIEVIEKFSELIVSKISKLEVRMRSTEEKKIKEEIERAIDQLRLISERLQQQPAKVSNPASTSVTTHTIFHGSSQSSSNSSSSQTLTPTRTSHNESGSYQRF